MTIMELTPVIFSAEDFSPVELEAVYAFEERARQIWSISGPIVYKKKMQGMIEMHYTTKDIFRRTRIGKMIDPENYDTIERTSEESRILLVSKDGKQKKLIEHTSKSTDTVIHRHYHRRTN